MKRSLIPGFILASFLLTFISCQKELSQESNTNLATFSLIDDSTQECLSTPVVHGTYYNGVSAAYDSANYVTVIVNVKSTGSYTISSNSQNGFSFFDSGFFSKTGLNTLTLHPRGTPILITTTEFTMSDTTCPFLVDVQDSTGTGLGGADTSGNGGSGSTFDDSSYTDNSPASENTWHFTDSLSGNSYSGTFVTNGTIENDNEVYTLTLAGPATDLTHAFGISLELPGGVVQPGVYGIRNSDNILGMYVILDETIIYQSDENVAEDGLSNSYITITSYDAATKHIQGSFHCWTEDENGGNLTLIKGSFNTFID